MFNQNDKEKKLDWMYKGANSLVDREDYLLGKSIDKSLEQLNAEEKQKQSGNIPPPKNHVEHECIPPSIREYKMQQKIVEQVDLQAKLQEDPLLAIKKHEEETRRQFLQNPVQLKKLQKALSKQNKKSKKRKKSDLDAKLAEKLHFLKDYSVDSTDNKQTKKQKRDKDMEIILMHKFNALKGKLSEKDLKDIMDGNITDSDESSSSDEDDDESEEELNKKVKQEKKMKKHKKKSKKRDSSDDESSSSDENAKKVKKHKRNKRRKKVKVSKKKRKESSSSDGNSSDSSEENEKNIELPHRNRNPQRNFRRDNSDERGERRNGHKHNFNDTWKGEYDKNKIKDGQQKRNKVVEFDRSNRRDEFDKNNRCRTEDSKSHKEAYDKYRSKNCTKSRQERHDENRKEEFNKYRREDSGSITEDRNKRHQKADRRNTEENMRELNKKKYDFKKEKSNKLKGKRSSSSSSNNSELKPKCSTSIEKLDRYQRKRSRSDSKEFNKIKRSRSIEKVNRNEIKRSRSKSKEFYTPEKRVLGPSRPPDYSHLNSDSEEDVKKVKNWGLVKSDGTKIPLSKVQQNSRPEKSTTVAEPKKEEYKRKKRLTEEEKETLRQEMVRDAAHRDKERAHNLKKHRELESKEETKNYKTDFIHRELQKSAHNSTVESRIKSNLNNIQRSGKAMNAHFSKRN